MKVRLKEKHPQEESAVIVLEEDFETALLYNILIRAKNEFHTGTNEHEFCELLIGELER